MDLFNAILTYLGIIALHASVDLLNDYWDYKRGIDLITKRTKFSGGTGVLPEGLLNPKDVYRVGLIMLIIGSTVGIYFIAIKGIVIALLLTFAIISIYFYSNKIVNLGLGEIFVAIKGCMIVLGTFYIQVNSIPFDAMLNGIIIGILSSTVLFINSFPDYDADKSKGRKTLVIILGKDKASKLFLFFPLIIYSIIIIGILSNLITIYALLTFLALFFLINAIRRIRKIRDADLYVMNNTLKFSRSVGLLLLLSYILDVI
ncbi:MAG: prenyltransferase [Candidatus Nitrosocaldaceae archaeon]